MYQHPLVGFALKEDGRLATAIGAVPRKDALKKLDVHGKRVTRDVTPVYLVLIDAEGNELIVDPDKADLKSAPELGLIETTTEQVLGVPRRLPSGLVVVPYYPARLAGHWACVIADGPTALYPTAGQDLTLPETQLLSSPALTPALN